jgi:hypothetical protein
MKSIFLALLSLVFTIAGFSQAIKVTEATVNMGRGLNNGFVVEIPQAAVKDIERDWKHRITVGNKAKLTETNGEVVARGVDNKDIAGQLFNVYCVTTSTAGGVKFTAWFTFDDTIFFATKSGRSEANAASRFVRDFASAEYFITVKNTYEKEREKLDKMRDDLEKSIRAQEKSALKISENKRAIARAQEELATNDNDQMDATTAVNLQQAEVEKRRNGNPDIYKAADKELKELQDEAKKLKNRNTDLHKKIDEWNKENTAEERNITSAKKDQAKATDTVEKQKSLIKDLAAKLKAIKA